MEAGSSGIQGEPWLHSEYMATRDPISKEKKRSMYACTQASTHARNLKCGQYTVLSDIIDFSLAQMYPLGGEGECCFAFSSTTNHANSSLKLRCQSYLSITSVLPG